ncbi:MAG: hypothetical protein SCALA701_14050 [Candidatus Scalindua sp.]|nr:MAG: hypothetical protein SCALA701_14050 [Candidatus Scalindua sp.]
MALEAPTREELISYLEATVPLDTGIETDFSARIIDKQMVGTKREKYKVKIVNKNLMIIEKDSRKMAKNFRDANQSFATSQENFTEVIELENLNPQISLIYKIRPTVGDDALHVVYPPHIKIKINAKPTKKWKRYNKDIEQVIAMINQNQEKALPPFSETDTYLLITTDEEAAKEIGKALSHLILLSQQKERKDTF